MVVSYFRTKPHLLLHFIHVHLFFLQTYSTEFNDPENWMEEACTGLPDIFHGKHMVKTIFSCKSCLEPTHPTAPRVTCSLPRSKGTPWCRGRSTCRSSRPRVVCAGGVHAPLRITPGRAAIPACPGRMMSEWIIIYIYMIYFWVIREITHLYPFVVLKKWYYVRSYVRVNAQQGNHYVVTSSNIQHLLRC